MITKNAARRYFMKATGVGIAGAAVGAFANRASAETASAPASEYDVRQFGAKGDGKTLDTPAINRAIDAAAAAGGATVRFSAGTYLCYSIHLKSNVDLYLGPGATILAADSPAPGVSGGYDPPEPNAWDKYQDFGHSHWHNSLIWGEDIENVSIIGPGLIWGKGLNRGDRDTVLAAGVGNKSISLKNCHNIILRDFSMLHAGHFAILATGVDNLTIDNLKIDTNRDGMDIDCCRNVRVSNCSVNSPWDDGVCLKSSYGLGYARSTDHVTITNCYVTGGYEEGTLLDASHKRLGPDKASRNGRIKFGTESNGGFRNITVSNCVINDCRGLALETVDGAFLEDVSITNITMRDIVDVPLFLRLGRRMRGPEGVPVGELRRVNISNIVVSNCASRQASIITGIPGHSIQDVKLSNMLILHQGGGTKEDAAIQPPEIENSYPEPDRFGPMPAHGFYIRHVKGIEMRDVEVRYMKDDMRPTFTLEDVEGADFIHVKAQQTAGAPAFTLRNVRDFSTYQSRPVPDTHLDKVEQQEL
ncbi:MAG: glycoside hydrolase family 28 protein [Candidatus Sulfotelmatobacter sp.]